MAWPKTTVIPAQAGIQWFAAKSHQPWHSLLESRVRGNDGTAAMSNPLNSDRPARFSVISAPIQRLFRH